MGFKDIGYPYIANLLEAGRELEDLCQTRDMYRGKELDVAWSRLARLDRCHDGLEKLLGGVVADLAALKPGEGEPETATQRVLRRHQYSKNPHLPHPVCLGCGVAKGTKCFSYCDWAAAMRE